ncbi:MAG TPA: c-type cytochrome [Polyangiaceae bacterium]|nr:c-type cytochrome [Polyangiaceae bacterium]
MKKLHWLAAAATILISAPAMTGCSGTDTTPPPPTTAGTGGTAGVGGSGAGGSATGVQLQPPNSYTILSGADATPNSMPTPSGWMSGGCNTCHQANGEGFAGLAPEIRHIPVDYAQWVVRNGRTWNGVATSMVAFPMTSADPKVLAISDADLTAVLTWLNTAPKPTTGPGLYKDFCGNCHGPTTGTGGIIPISIVGKSRMEITQKVRNGEGTDKSMRNLFMPPHSAMELSDAELGMIMDYVMAVSP